jgi:outer membrane protein OmpA-like peptidoglycan-associated protein
VKPIGRIALASLLLVACDHRPEDFTAVRDEAGAFQATWKQRIDLLTARHAALFQRAQQIPAGAQGLDQVLSSLASARVQIDELSPRVETTSGEAFARIQERHRKLAADALARGNADLTATLESLTRQLDEAGAQLDAVAAAAAVPPEPPPPPPATSITDPAFAKARGGADVAGIVFQPGTAAFDLSKASTREALDSIEAFANTCPELRFAIVGHTAKDGDANVNQKLSEAQAQAVQKHLVVLRSTRPRSRRSRASAGPSR